MEIYYTIKLAVFSNFIRLRVFFGIILWNDHKHYAIDMTVFISWTEQPLGHGAAPPPLQKIKFLPAIYFEQVLNKEGS